MSESNEAKNFAAASSGKSPEEVAFELVSKLKGQGVWGERNISAILDMYAECLDATKGLRAYEGQKRVAAPVPPQAAPLQRVQSQRAQGQHPQTQPVSAQPATVQTVQAQQQALQQAFKQE